MGASASVTQQEVKNTMITNATNSCGADNASNVINISGVNYSQPPGCPAGSGFNINQAASVDANCLIQQLVSQAANTTYNLNTSTKAGLGFSVSDTQSDINNTYTTNINNSCAGLNDTNYVNMSDVNVEACNFVVTQNATAKSQCQINSAQNQVATVAGAVTTNTQGGSLFGDLFGNFSFGKVIVVIVVIVVLFVVIGVGYRFYSNSKKNKNTGSNIDTDDTGTDDDLTQDGGFLSLFIDSGSLNAKIQRNKPYIILIIVVLLVLVVFIVNRSDTPEKQITENDVNNLSQTINEAQIIAGLAPVQPSRPQTPQEPIVYQQLQSPQLQSPQLQSPQIYSPHISDTRYSESPVQSENNFYQIGYNYAGEENSLDDFYKPLLY
ncbi:myristoylated membrane protein [Tupanvirus soda lake]|uniref:Myristoylated membrane protein n=2 Tax=Tupanvirus TaxID=2094720 RepID=A0A6N1NUI4_9VIRU|nr:myristoylated membrane protein [Tupanvirus soda lake]QKU35083.1 myristoylated membrane protein [Tupanvirus soda lake]